MAVYTTKKTYHTKAHMGMIDVTEDFQHAVSAACREREISDGIVTGFTTGGVAGLTTLEFEPGMVNHDLKAALDVF
ncbi:MAG: secondary thiamine-phosphate synthase, partial [Oscillibacter sp.]|nr:secondary thiamine-phosphate synthase [Oscillibacter sp.]